MFYRTTILVGLIHAVVASLCAADDRPADQQQATVRWILQLQAPEGGFYLQPPNPNLDVLPQPSLRATSGAVRALLHLGVREIPHRDRHAAFVLKCLDARSGGFAEPGGKPDVFLTSIGIMAAVALDIPKPQYAAAMKYLQEHAKSFEEIRIAAAGVEAWGVTDCPFDLKPWLAAGHQALREGLQQDARGGGARLAGSAAALILRLGGQLEPEVRRQLLEHLRRGQLPDGGYARDANATGDLESTYRVLRAWILLREPPPNPQTVRQFLQRHRHTSGGYATPPDGPPTMSGTYYAAVISHWLDAAAKK